MEVTRNEVVDAIARNDVDRVAKILGEFGFSKSESPPVLTMEGVDLVADVLGFAAAMSYQHRLEDGLANEIIERTAMMADIFPLLQCVTICAGIDDYRHSKIPKQIRESLIKNDYSHKIARMIEGLDVESFESLIAFIVTCDDVQRTDIRFSMPIIKLVYKKQTIPRELLFTYMATFHRETVDRLTIGFARLLGFSMPDNSGEYPGHRGHYS